MFTNDVIALIRHKKYLHRIIRNSFLNSVLQTEKKKMKIKPVNKLLPKNQKQTKFIPTYVCCSSYITTFSHQLNIFQQILTNMMINLEIHTILFISM